MCDDMKACMDWHWIETITKPAPSVVTLKDVDLNSVDALGRRKIEMLDFFAKGILSYYLDSSGPWI